MVSPEGACAAYYNFGRHAGARDAVGHGEVAHAGEGEDRREVAGRSEVAV